MIYIHISKGKSQKGEPMSEGGKPEGEKPEGEKIIFIFTTINKSEKPGNVYFHFGAFSGMGRFYPDKIKIVMSTSVFCDL